MIQQLLNLLLRIFEPVGVATVASVAGATATTPLVKANGSRKGFACYNDSTSIAYVKMGPGASSTLYTIQMAAQSYWEMPVGGAGPFTGQIDAAWVSATGNMLVTEW